jgi:hypothetical protein
VKNSRQLSLTDAGSSRYCSNISSTNQALGPNASADLGSSAIAATEYGGGDPNAGPAVTLSAPFLEG